LKTLDIIIHPFSIRMQIYRPRSMHSITIFECSNSKMRISPRNLISL
jgi:hypothetical protein